MIVSESDASAGRERRDRSSGGATVERVPVAPYGGQLRIALADPQSGAPLDLSNVQVETVVLAS